MSIRKGTTIIAGNSSPLDWTGTLQEYNIALENGTIKENMVCYITDDTLYTDDIRPEIETLNSVKANKDLSNLSEVGEKHFLNKSQITNCITEIPQNIKVELVDGTLTLKAGSKVIVPNGKNADGSNKFDEVVIESDITRSSFGSTSQQIFVMPVYSNGKVTSISYNFTAQALSGTTPPESGNFYNTNTNYLNSYNTGAVVDQRAFPIVIVTIEAGVPTSIDQVFNGCGVFGSTIWVDKGVKGLTPNGRNEDGTLNNSEFITEQLLLRTITYNGNISVFLNPQHTGLFVPATEQVYYDEQKNIITNTNTGEIYYSCILASAKRENNVITSFQPKLPFRAVDYNDKQDISGWGMPSGKYIDLTLGASDTTYTAPANGYFTCQVVASSQLGFVWMYTDYMGTGQGARAGTNADGCRAYLPVKKGEKITVTYQNTSRVEFFRFIYAQGEV